MIGQLFVSKTSTKKSAVFFQLIFAFILAFSLIGVQPVRPVQAATYNWTAFNDSASPYLTSTESNITKYSYSGTLTGLLKNISTGASTEVTATFSKNDTGTTYQTTTAGVVPTTGTDAYDTFSNFVSTAGVINGMTGSWWIDVTFTGLNPAKTYTFAGTTIRNGGYTTRNTTAILTGDTSATNASTSGVTIVDNHTIAFNSGGNSAGYVVRWTGINPGSDGAIVIRTRASTTAEIVGSIANSYGFSVFMLAEESTDPNITTTGTLSPFNAAVGTQSAEQSYSVSGTNLTAAISVAAPDDFQVSLTSGSGWASSVTTAAPSGGTVGSTTIYVRLNPSSATTYNANITNTSAGATTKNMAVTGSSVPTITTSVSSLVAFRTHPGTPSDVQTYTVSGINLTDGIDISAPVGFEISADGGSTWINPLNSPYYITLAQSGGVITTTTISVRMTGTDEGGFGGDIGNVSSGAETKNVAVTGLVTSEICVTTRIAVGSDDVEQRINTGSTNGDVDLDGDTANKWLQMYRAYGGSTTDLNWWGLRFLNVNVPNSATITSADVTFRAAETSGTTDSAMTLWGQEATNPSTFTTTDNDVSSRAKTTASVNWVVPQWTNGSDYATPNMTTVVQEIVNQVGWVANNALVIVGQTTTSQNRTAISFNSTNGATLAPQLEVCYTMSTDPTILTSVTELQPFTTTPGVPSAEQSYTVSGINLTGNIAITAPTGFQVSTTSGSGFGSTLSLTPSSGTVAATPIYVRLYSTTVNTFSGNITHTSSGATTKNVAVEGTVSNQICYTDQTFVASEDTYISGYNTDYNYGGVNLFKVTNNSSGTNRGALLRWDLDSLPDDATVSSASLKLYVSTASNQAYNLYNMRQTWVEGTTTSGATSTTSATWETYDGTNAWGTVGAANTTSDRFDTNLWSTTTSTFTPAGSKTIALNSDGIAAVQGWITSPANNFGVTMQSYSTTSGSDDLQISSSENTTTANRPTLLLNYCVGSANSAPAAPVLVQPTDNATGVSTSPTLQVTVTDPDADAMDVSFYGRPVSSGTPAEDFLFIAVPDTQNLATSYATTMSNQFQWIANRYTTPGAGNPDLVYVTNLGDIVNSSGSTTEWAAADTAYDKLDAAGVPYSVGPGNHDLGTLYSTNFGSARFTGKSWYQGYYTSGSDNYNSYSFFSAGGMDFIIINLQYSPSSTGLDWADALLKDNPTKRGIVAQHDILNIDNNWVNYPSVSPTFTALSDNPNLFLILCGHMHGASDGSAYLQQTRTGMNPVHIVQTDYQDYSGKDYIRLLTFKPSTDEIYAQVYAPTNPTGGYLTNASNYEQFTMAYDMPGTTAAPFELIGTYLDVPSGISPSILWPDRLNDTEYEWYAVASDGSLSTSTQSSPWSFTTAPVVNNPPTNITLSGSTIAENAAANTVVGTLSTTDPDAGDTFTYTLVSGTGSTDNSSFNISSDSLRATAAFNYETKNSYSVRIRTTDQGGQYYEKAFTITVTNVNEAPTDITLSVSSVAENAALNTEVGNLSTTDPDASNVFYYTLVSGEGSTDNTSFAIAGNGLLISEVFDFETKSSYSIRIRTTDGGGLYYEEAFTITVTDVNEAPVAVADNYSTLQNTKRDVAVPGVLVNDSDVDGDSLTAVLVSGVSHGALTLNPNGSFSYTPTTGYIGADSFSYKANDGALDSNIVTVAITVTDANETPIDISLSNSSLVENSAANAVVGTLSSTDPDAGDTFTYTLVSGTGDTDNGSFNILSDSLRASAPFNYEAKNSYSVRIRTTDGGGLYYEEAFTINVTDVNEAPTDIALSATSVAENAAANTVVGTLSSTDPDAGDTFTYMLVSGSGDTDNGSFNFLTNSLRATAPFNYESKNSYSVRIRTTDGGGLYYEEAFTITVTNVNEAPTDIALSANTVAENSAVNTVVGTLSTTDPDAGGSFTYSIVGGDTASFNISGSSLRTSAAFDFETKASYTVTIRTTDGGSLTYEEAFTITVTDVTETPCTTVNLVAAEDTYMSAYNDDYNYGSVNLLKVTNYYSSIPNRGALLKWDLSSIPAGYTITEASLGLNVSTAGAKVYNLYNMRRAWVEGTNTSGTTSTTSANWNTYDGQNAWGTAGAANTSTDRYDVNMWDADATTFASTGLKTAPLNANGIAVLQGWITGPNYGVTIQNYQTSGSNDDLQISSSENSTVANRPTLNVTYCLTSTDPTITVSSSMTGFSTPVNQYSPEQSYTVTGANLTENITVTAPVNFEVSLTSGSGFASSVSLPQTGGTIYVRFKAASVGTTTANITHAGTGITKNLEVTGNAYYVYTLTVGNDGNGTVTLNPATGPYASGTTVTLSPVPNSGYVFKNWSGTNAGDIIDTAGVYTIVMNSDKSVTANFEVSLCTSVDVVAAEDTYLSANGVTQNNGGNTSIHVDATTGTGRRTALMLWDLSAIPDGVTVSDASMTVNVTDASSLIFNLYNMRRAWVEGTSTQTNSSDSANWNTYDGVNGWGTVGAASTTEDRYDTNLWGAGATSFSSTGSKTVDLNADGKAVLQGWVDGLPNYGLTIQNYYEATANAVFFSSSEATTASQRPKLNITYCVPSDVPTITVTGTLTPFSTPLGTPSAVQTYTVSGVNLTNNIDISGVGGFELSPNGTTFSSGLTLTQSSGTVPSTTIYVRLTGAALGEFSGDIAHVSSGATNKNVYATGTVTQYYSLTVGNDSNGSVTLNPTGGSYPSGTTVTLTPVPNSGYAFKNWSGTNAGDIIDTAGVYTIVMNGNKSVTANFEVSLCTSVDVVAAADTYLSGYNTTNNYGAQTYMRVTLGTTQARGSLIRWNLNDVPTNAVISEANIKLNVSTAGSATFNLYNLRRAWVEGTGAGSATGDGATWNSYDGNTADTWGSAGAANTTSDRYTENLWGAGSTSFNSTGDKTIALNAAGLGVVQDWVDGTLPNYGFTIQNYTTGSTDVQFSTKDNSTEANRPKLSITYCVPATDIEITGFDPIPAIQAGQAGSALNLAAVEALLPVSAMASTASGPVSVPVTAWVNTDSYNPSVPGSYTFTATLGTIPAGYANTGGYTATIEVVVSVADIEITGFDPITAIQAGQAGSALNLAGVQALLPVSAMASTASGSVSVPVIAWVNTDSYNPAVPGSYTFTATLGAIPTGYANTGGYTATIEVVVSTAPSGFIIYLPLIFK